MAGCCWRMTVSTNTSNTGWLYNCIIWFYSFYWLMPSSLILPAPNHEVKCVRTKPDKEEERIDARMGTCNTHPRVLGGGRYGNLEITRLCCMYGGCSIVEERSLSLLWL